MKLIDRTLMLYMIKKCWHAMHGKWNINFNVDPIFPAA